MKGAQITGDQVSAYIEGDYDLKGLFPKRPCLIKELLFLPCGDTDLIVLGIDGPRLIKVDGSRTEILKLLRLLDGNKTAAELQTVVDDPKIFSDLQALFFWHGLLQDGPISQPDPADQLSASFFGRYVNLTRTNRNRDEALNRLKQHRLAVYAPASISEELSEILRSTGVKSHLLVANIDDLSKFEASFFLVIADGTEMAEHVLRIAYESGQPCLLSTIGSGEARIGPLILPGLTAGHACVSEQLSAIDCATDQNELLFWAALSLQEAILQMSSIGMVSYCNRAMVHYYGKYSTFHTLARLPGSRTSGLTHVEPLSVKSSGFQAWKHHCSVRISSKEYLAPASHFGHYSAYSLGARRLPVPAEYGLTSHPLPEEWELPATLPWLDSDRNSKPFDARSVGNLLRVAVGHDKNQDRRISPTGGDLKSAGFFIRTDDVIGIENGWYAYNPNEHLLEAIPNWDADAAAAALPPFSEPPPVVIVVVLRLQRVREKYQDFSYNVVHLDAGVATAFASLVADSFGWEISHHPNVPISSLAHSLGIDDQHNCRIVSNVFSVNKASPLSNGHVEETSLDWLIQSSRVVDTQAAKVGRIYSERNLRFKELQERSASISFEEALTSRRAIRSFEESSVSAALLEDLARLGHRARQRLQEEGMLSIPISIYALRVYGDDVLPSGAYETNVGPTEGWKCVSAPMTFDDIYRCLNQSSLTRAPLLFVAVADLNRALQHYGAAGYRHTLNQCGFILSQIWLAAHAAGLVGTMCGGLLDEGMRNAIKSDGYTAGAMVGLVLGEPNS